MRRSIDYGYGRGDTLTTEGIAAIAAAAGILSGLLGAYLNHLRNRRLDGLRASTRERRDNATERQQAVEHYDKLADRLERYVEEIGKKLKECEEQHAQCENEQLALKLELAMMKGRVEEISRQQGVMIQSSNSPILLTGKPELVAEEVEDIQEDIR